MEALKAAEEFKKELINIAQQLVAAGAKRETWHDDDGREYHGWAFEYGDHPTKERINENALSSRSSGSSGGGGTPYYLGGSWGEWAKFLDADGQLWRYDFVAREEWVGKPDLEKSERHEVQAIPLGDVVGTGKPFSQIKRKIEAAAAKLILR